MTTPDSRLWLTVTEAADHLGVSVGSIRRWADLGLIECYRTPGGQRRFRLEQLEQFIENMKETR